MQPRVTRRRSSSWQHIEWGFQLDRCIAKEDAVHAHNMSGGQIGGLEQVVFPRSVGSAAQRLWCARPYRRLTCRLFLPTLRSYL